MKSDLDPYQSPGDSIGSPLLIPAFTRISTGFLVALFFLPSACFAFSFFAGLQLQSNLLAGISLALTPITGLLVAIFSARIHTIVGDARFGTQILLTFVYLLAQLLALMILRFGIEIMIHL